MTYFEPAPHFNRFAAATLDLSFLIFTTNLIALKALKKLGLDKLAENPVEKLQTGEVTLAAIWVFVALLVAITTLMHLYFVWFETNKSATPGKMLFNLEVVSQSDEPLTKRQAMKRELARWYLDLPLILVSVIPMIATNKRLRFGDMLAKTQVIQRKRVPDPALNRKVTHARTPTRPKGP